MNDKNNIKFNIKVNVVNLSRFSENLFIEYGTAYLRIDSIQKISNSGLEGKKICLSIVQKKWKKKLKT